ncbi:MAG: class I SAM-dependent methyltransferase, partial [Burkholderiaceae bacterium]
FDVVVTRFSAHHWSDVPAAMKEVHRVLRPGGVAVIIDIIASENPLHDTTLQAVELLRDASHVRDYRSSEWASMLEAAGFSYEQMSVWRLKMVFDEWIARMRTPEWRTVAIRSLLDTAPEETRAYFSVEPDYSFFIDAALLEATKR